MPASEWRTVSLVIDNGHIRFTSDSQTEQKNTFGKKKNNFHHQLINTIFFKFKTIMTFIFYLSSGVLERAPCGLKLGWGEGYENFNGCIDEVRYSCIVYCYWNSCNRNIHASLTVSNFISDCFFYARLGHKCVTVVFLVIVAESTSKRPLWLIA